MLKTEFACAVLKVVYSSLWFNINVVIVDVRSTKYILTWIKRIKFPKKLIQLANKGFKYHGFQASTIPVDRDKVAIQ
jgi:hypothetical protein